MGRTKITLTLSKCKKIASKYHSSSEWKEKDFKTYTAAKRYKWTKECKSFYKDAIILSLENYSKIAKQFHNFIEWKEKDSKTFNKLKRAKVSWKKELKTFFKGYEPAKNKKEHFFWTFEKCFEEAKKHNNKRQWRSASQSSYGRALKKGWLVECCAHMTGLQNQKPAGYWSKEMCLDSAKNFSRPSDWARGNGGAYSSAMKKGWLPECCAHMTIRKIRGSWYVKQSCLEDAKKYTTKTEWISNSQSAVKVAKKKGWYAECTAHMVNQHIPPKQIHQFILNKAKGFNSSREWFLKDNKNYNKAIKNGWLIECTSHMVDYKTSQLAQLKKSLANIITNEVDSFSQAKKYNKSLRQKLLEIISLNKNIINNSKNVQFIRI